MINPKLIAPCGMNCALCSSYQAEQNQLKEQGINTSYCPGCRIRGKNCAFILKHCSKLSKEEIEFCYECADFPCDHLQTLDKRYRTKYHMSMIENLRSIKSKGTDKFLKNQEKIWRCPKCDDLICCHNGLCFTCDLTKFKNRKFRYQWEE